MSQARVAFSITAIWSRDAPMRRAIASSATSSETPVHRPKKLGVATIGAAMEMIPTIR